MLVGFVGRLELEGCRLGGGVGRNASCRELTLRSTTRSPASDCPSFERQNRLGRLDRRTELSPHSLEGVRGNLAAPNGPGLPYDRVGTSGGDLRDGVLANRGSRPQADLELRGARLVSEPGSRRAYWQLPYWQAPLQQSAPVEHAPPAGLHGPAWHVP